MKLNRTLGEKINRGFVIIVVVLGSIIAIRVAVAVSKENWKPPYEYNGDQ